MVNTQPQFYVREWLSQTLKYLFQFVMDSADYYKSINLSVKYHTVFMPDTIQNLIFCLIWLDYIWNQKKTVLISRSLLTLFKKKKMSVQTQIYLPSAFESLSAKCLDMLPDSLRVTGKSAVVASLALRCFLAHFCLSVDSLAGWKLIFLRLWNVFNDNTSTRDPVALWHSPEAELVLT